MSDTVLIALGAVEVVGLIGLYALIQRNKKRRAAGEERDPRWLRITIALFGLVVLVGYPAMLLVWVMNPSAEHERVRERLVQDGTPATATITRIKQTGRMINQQPEIQVLVSVHPEGGADFNSQSTWVFSVTDTQNYRVGTEVNVLYDPSDRGAVAIVGLAPAPE